VSICRCSAGFLESLSLLVQSVTERQPLAFGNRLSCCRGGRLQRRRDDVGHITASRAVRVTAPSLIKRLFSIRLWVRHHTAPSVAETRNREGDRERKRPVSKRRKRRPHAHREIIHRMHCRRRQRDGSNWITLPTVGCRRSRRRWWWCC